MNRRGFFENIARFFEKKGDGGVFIGVQLVMSTYQRDDFRRKLHERIAEQEDLQTPKERQSYYKKLLSLLEDNFVFVEYGFWDFLNSGSEDADHEFRSWVSEIQASAATEDEEMGEEIDTRISNDKNYVVVTLAFVLEAGRSVDAITERIEAMDEKQLFTRAAFASVLDTLRLIDFSEVQSDASFVIPGNDEDGFSWEDLHGGGWEYLRSIA